MTAYFKLWAEVLIEAEDAKDSEKAQAEIADAVLSVGGVVEYEANLEPTETPEWAK